MYIDTHTHFDIILEETTINEDLLIKNLAANNINSAVQVSIDIKSSSWSYNFAKKYKENGILFTIGIHPSSIAGDKEHARINDLLNSVMNSDDSDLLFGIGECGLDYYRMRQEKDVQIRSFEKQIHQAKKWNLPIVIHSRDAMDDTLDILKKNSPITGIMHCFPGDAKTAKKVLDLGLYISFAGNVTYNKATNLHEAAAYVPLNRLLIETDSPFLTPVPLRGKKNRSEYIINTYKFISDLRKESLSTIIDAVYNNFNSLKAVKK